jgi:hypothetical protein
MQKKLKDTVPGYDSISYLDISNFIQMSARGKFLNFDQNGRTIAIFKTSKALWLLVLQIVTISRDYWNEMIKRYLWAYNAKITVFIMFYWQQLEKIFPNLEFANVTMPHLCIYEPSQEVFYVEVRV